MCGVLSRLYCSLIQVPAANLPKHSGYERLICIPPRSLKQYYWLEEVERGAALTGGRGSGGPRQTNLGYADTTGSFMEAVTTPGRALE